jgi:hypothetical protein
MDELRAHIRQVAQSEVEMLLAERERLAGLSAGQPEGRRRLAPWLWWSLEVTGAVLLGVLCGVASHVAAVLLARALG